MMLMPVTTHRRECKPFSDADLQTIDQRLKEGMEVNAVSKSMGIPLSTFHARLRASEKVITVRRELQDKKRAAKTETPEIQNEGDVVAD